MEYSASAPRCDSFPAGLRVLVVDDDPTWLKILEKMLKKCLYEVTTCGLAREALNLLRERKDGFDIVISDVNMPDMDGFKLLEYVGLEMDLPVIIMSVDGETSRVMKGVQHGACDYLLKPIRMKELRNIWQHVLRKRIHGVRDNESHDSLEDIQLMENGSPYMEDRYFHCGTDVTSRKKRRDFENKHDDRCSDPSSVKKPRVVWTIDLHQKFVQAVNQVGLEKVGPKKILDLMGVPWLTRENVASHLQKYRLYLSRLQKEKELNASFSRMKRPDVSSNERKGLQKPSTQTLNDSTGGYCQTSRNGSTSHNVDFKVLEGDMECTVSNAKEPKKLTEGDNPNAQKTSTAVMNFRNPFGQFDSEVKLAKTIREHNSWNADSGFNLWTLPPFQQNIKVECLQSASCTKSNPSRSDITAEEVNSAIISSRRNSTIQLSPDISTIDLFSLLAGTELTCEHSVKPNSCTLSSIKYQTIDQIPVADLNSDQQRVHSGSMTASASVDEKARVCSIGGDLQPLNVGFENVEPFYSSYPEHIAEGPACFHEYPKLDYEYPLDSVEFSAVDNGLFII